MEKCVVIVPTSYKYIDICEFFVALIRKYWSSCSYRIVLSVTGVTDGDAIQAHLKDCEVLINAQGVSLPTCVLNATYKYKAEFYLCMLGDAFFTKEFDVDRFEMLLNSMKEKQVDYCSMLPVKTPHKTFKCNKISRYINKRDRYAYSFVAYIATQHFIKEEFKDNIGDFEFEMKHLTVAENLCNNQYDKKAIGLMKNYFFIYPGIYKGKWDRRVYFKLKRENPELELPFRPLLLWREMIYIYGSALVSGRIPRCLYKLIKNASKCIEP